MLVLKSENQSLVGLKIEPGHPDFEILESFRLLSSKPV
jgi:hypothetical protein